ncbi:MAG: cyclic nucleotide-binding domain-containing protein [Syntrophaceae bacterium]|nr:cyclic nucleotide-binding domain-containing protein [Syntrophaceae bacterium]
MDAHSVKENEELIQRVKSMATFRSFEKKDFYRILNFSKIKEYEPGELILAEGSYDNWIYFVLSGKVRIVRHEEEIGVLNRTGDIFGEMGIIDGSARSASIFALEKTICLATDISFIDRLTGDDRLAFTAILYQLLAEILAVRLRTTSEELVRAREEIADLKGGAGR